MEAVKDLDQVWMTISTARIAAEELHVPLLGMPTPVSRTMIDAVFSAYTTSTLMDPTKVSGRGLKHNNGRQGATHT